MHEQRDLLVSAALTSLHWLASRSRLASTLPDCSPQSSTLPRRASTALHHHKAGVYGHPSVMLFGSRCMQCDSTWLAGTGTISWASKQCCLVMSRISSHRHQAPCHRYACIVSRKSKEKSTLVGVGHERPWLDQWRPGCLVLATVDPTCI